MRWIPDLLKQFLAAVPDDALHSPTLDTIFRLLPGLRVDFVEFCQEFERILKAARD